LWHHLKFPIQWNSWRLNQRYYWCKYIRERRRSVIKKFLLIRVQVLTNKYINLLKLTLFHWLHLIFRTCCWEVIYTVTYTLYSVRTTSLWYTYIQGGGADSCAFVFDTLEFNTDDSIISFDAGSLPNMKRIHFLHSFHSIFCHVNPTVHVCEGVAQCITNIYTSLTTDQNVSKYVYYYWK
jgi:hypothetical protein